MEIMRERETETKTEGERQSDSIGSRGWWLPWGAASGWRRVRGREGKRENHVRSHVSERRRRRGGGMGSVCRQRDWREAESAQYMRRQGRGCAYVTACSG